MQEKHVESSLYSEDEPFERPNDKTLIDESINSTVHEVQKQRENHRHAEVLHTLKTAENLVSVSIFLLFLIWLISFAFGDAEKREYTGMFVEIFKTIILTTIGFICGNKMK